MSTPISRKTYTRRNTRTRLIDILKEAIELVEKGCPPGHMTRGPTSVLPPMVKAKAPLSAIAEENLRSQANSLLVASQTELANNMKAQNITAVPIKEKVKGVVRPGVLKYNEYVKKWISEHPEYQAKGKYQAALKEIQRSGNWSSVSGTRKKVKNLVPVTATRLSPVVPMSLTSMFTNATAKPVNAATPATATPTPAAATPSMPYTNDGMDDTVGMRKISMEGRNLYMSSDNGLFEREGNSPGDFIGRLVDGKIVEEETPELPEYS